MARRAVAALAILCPAALLAQDVALPKPDTTGGGPLMQVLAERKSSREFSSERLPPAELANLLWAAFGVNRPESGGRTAPSAKNGQETDVYVACADGLYLYDAKANVLKQVSKADVRSLTGRQPFVSVAPVDLVYVADYSRMPEMSAADKDRYSAAGAGFIAENVYLYCASSGLAVVVRGSIDRDALAKAMKLRPEQRIILAQTVGYPAKKP